MPVLHRQFAATMSAHKSAKFDPFRAGRARLRISGYQEQERRESAQQSPSDRAANRGPSSPGRDHVSKHRADNAEENDDGVHALTLGARHALE